MTEIYFLKYQLLRPILQQVKLWHCKDSGTRQDRMVGTTKDLATTWNINYFLTLGVVKWSLSQYLGGTYFRFSCPQPETRTTLIPCHGVSFDKLGFIGLTPKKWVTAYFFRRMGSWRAQCRRPRAWRAAAATCWPPGTTRSAAPVAPPTSGWGCTQGKACSGCDQDPQFLQKIYIYGRFMASIQSQMYTFYL